MSISSDIVNSCLNFLCPSICIICEKKTITASEYICSVCFQSLDRFSTPELSRISIDWRLRSHPDATLINDAVGLFYFNESGAFENMIYTLKYHRIPKLGVILGRELAKFLENDPILKNTDVVTFVPIHKVKKIERGFNQSEQIAKGFCEVTNLCCEPWLKRKFYSLSQTKIKGTEEARRKNTENAFKVASLVVNKNILLIDDVFTTGATLLAIANELKKKGANKVFAATVGVRQSE